MARISATLQADAAASVSQYQADARMVDVDGKEIAYWQCGQGPDVWFLHGFPSATWDWHHQWQSLSASFCCHGFDFLGFGLSAKPFPHPYSILEQADICERLMAHSGVTQVKLVAHDYGVSVAQELLRRKDQGLLHCDIEQVIFLNGGLFADKHRPLLTQKLLHGPLGWLFARLMSKRTLKSGFSKIFAPTSPPSNLTIDVLWYLLQLNHGNRVLPALLQYLDERVAHQQHWLSAMRNVDIPLAFINGVHDPISGKHMLEAFLERVPGATGIALDAGHYPQIELPQQVTEHLRRLLAGSNQQFKAD